MAMRYPGGFITATAPTVNANTAKGVWTLEEAMQYIKAGQWPVPTGNGDPYFQYNTLLLPGQGTNGANNNTFLDSSTNNFTITRNGNTTQGTFTPFSEAPGYWSNYFNGSVTTSYINSVSDTAFAFGTGDFTLEAFIYVPAYPTSGTVAGIIIAAHNWNGSGMNFIFRIGQTGLLYFENSAGNTLTASTAVALNTWAHVACVRSSGTVTFYINGTSAGSGSAAGSISSTTAVSIGNALSGGTFGNFNGYISNARITKGGALYTGTFTPSTTPLTTTVSAGTVSLLTCQSNRFIDNSVNAFALTTGATTSVQTFQPFGAPTSAYSAATFGGSGYFDGTGDWLTSATSGGNCVLSGDFTVESWVYPTSWGAYQRVISGGASTFYWTLGFSTTWGSGLQINWFDGSDYFSTAYSGSPLNTWYHLAVVRTGSTIYFYINGVRYGTSTYSATPGNANGGYMIGNRIGATEPWFGYMTDSRVVLGTNVYGTGSTITIPTAPLTAITNTSLLLNYTNAGVIDNAVSNNLETVGGAQISTTQYKWGASSIYFDGNGDNLSGPSTPALNCGTGDFTIEGWVYVSSRTLNYPVIFGNNNGSYTAGALALTNSSAANAAYNNKFCLNAYDINSSGPPALVSSSTNALNTWYHLALVRVGTTLKMFVNGNQTASTTISSSIVFNWGKGGVLVGGGNWDTTNSYFHGYINDLRLTNGYARYQYPFTAPAAPFPLFWQAAATPSSDPYFQNTTLLLPGNGTNGAQNNTFLDSSTNNFTITRNGNTTQGTFTPFSKVDGRWGNYFDGNGDYLSCGNNAALSAGAGDFTVEFWLSLNSIGVNDTSLWEARSSNGSATGFHIGALALTGGYCINFYTNATANLTSSLIPYRSWTHIAVARSGSSLKVYVNGISELSITNSANFSDTPTFTIGQSPLYSSNSLNGDMSNFRMVKGTAVYTSNFVPSTTPLTAITNTQLLTCQSNRFIDNSTNAFAITRNGDVSVQTFSPFPTTASYDASVNGGSGYFDGSGDYLTTSTTSTELAMGTGAFTIEAWVYTADTSFMIACSTTTGGYGLGYNIDSGTQGLWLGRVGTGLDAASGVQLAYNAWNHVAVTRDGSNVVKFWVNGTQSGSNTTVTSNYGTSAQAVRIAADVNASLFNLSGYLSSVRITKGAALYTGTFTPSSTPLTTTVSSGTVSFLANFTNGGIIDNTMSNNLETVDGASISTTQSKFGGSSMYFDGNDKVTLPYSQNFNLGTNYTIEGWVYPTSVTGYQRIFDIVNSATSSPAFLDIAFNGTALVSELRTTNGGSVTTISGGTVSIGAWIHVALSVYSGSARLFLNGVQVGSTTTFSALPDQNFVGIGGIGNSLTIDYLTGYIDDLRITKGIARYVQNFTPPTQAFLTL